MSVRHCLSVLTCVVCAWLLGTPRARADEESKRTCASAFANAQRLMRAGSLLEAKKKLVICGGPQCPVAMHPDCQQWLASVEASIPTVVFQVALAPGQSAGTVQLSVDGGDPVPLDGRAVSIDPGTHDVTFVASGFRPTTKHFVVSEGEKLRREVVTLAPSLEVRRNDERAGPIALAPAQPQAGEGRASRVTAPVIIAGSGAVLAGIGALYFGVKARSDDRQLSNCTPDCPRGQVDDVRRGYLLTNLSIGVAAVGLTTAIVLYLLQGRSVKRPMSSALGIGPGPTGLGTTATTTF
jgi:hypothetical protein